MYKSPEEITREYRELYKKMVKEAEEEGHTIIYGDTDSIYVRKN